MKETKIVLPNFNNLSDLQPIAPTILAEYPQHRITEELHAAQNRAKQLLAGNQQQVTNQEVTNVYAYQGKLYAKTANNEYQELKSMHAHKNADGTITIDEEGILQDKNYPRDFNVMDGSNNRELQKFLHQNFQNDLRQATAFNDRDREM